MTYHLLPRHFPGLVSYGFLLFFLVGTLAGGFYGNFALIWANQQFELAVSEVDGRMAGVTLVWTVAIISAGWWNFRTPTQQPVHSSLATLERKANESISRVSNKLKIMPPQLVLTRDGDVCLAGLKRPFRLLLPAGLALKAPANVLDAIISHELGHAANGDARLLLLSKGLEAALATMALVSFFMPATIFMYKFVLLALHYPTETPMGGWVFENALIAFKVFLLPLISSALLCRLCYAALLRRQELLADATVAACGFASTLQQLLLSAKRAHKITTAMKVAVIFSSHPLITTRISSISTGRSLKRTSIGEVLGLGILLGIAYEAVDDLRVLAFEESAAASSVTWSKALSETDFLYFFNEIGIYFYELAAQGDYSLHFFLLLMACSIQGLFILSVRDAVSSMANGKLPYVTTILANSLILFLGAKIGGLLWPNNLRDLYGVRTIEDFVNYLNFGPVDFLVNTLAMYFVLAVCLWLFQLFMQIRLMSYWKLRVGMPAVCFSIFLANLSVGLIMVFSSILISLVAEKPISHNAESILLQDVVIVFLIYFTIFFVVPFLLIWPKRARGVAWIMSKSLDN